MVDESLTISMFVLKMMRFNHHCPTGSQIYDKTSKRKETQG